MITEGSNHALQYLSNEPEFKKILKNKARENKEETVPEITENSKWKALGPINKKISLCNFKSQGKGKILSALRRRNRLPTKRRNQNGTKLLDAAEW